MIRNQQKLADTQKIYDLCCQKLAKLRESYILETRPDEKMRLESLIRETQHDCDALEKQLTPLEQRKEGKESAATFNQANPSR